MTHSAPIAAGATPHGPQTAANTPGTTNANTLAAATAPDPMLKTVAKVIARLATTRATAELHSVYGATLRGIVPKLFGGDGTTPLTNAVRLIISNGLPVGFVIGNTVSIDYTMPENAEALWHASSANLARGLRRPAIEEQLARAIAAATPAEELVLAIEAAGLREFERIRINVAHRIAFGIVSESIANATYADQQGSLNLLRALPPTIRFPLIHALLAHPKAEMIRDLIAAAPILALAPRLATTGAGRKPKELLRAVGLPVEARRMRPRALSPYRRLMLHDGRDLAIGDAPWMTPELLNALPEHSLNQYRVVTIAFGLLMHGMSYASVTERCIWVAANAAEIFDEGLSVIEEWLRADAAVLTALGIRAWTQNIGASAAVTAALDLRAASDAEIELDGATMNAGPFPLPAWATERGLPGSKWRLRPITNVRELIGAGHRNRNCAAVYADVCARGVKVIVEVVRPVTPGSKLPKDATGKEIGAMAEITHAWGRWHITQSKGFANGAPRATAHGALVRLVAELNGETPATAQAATATTTDTAPGA